MAGSANEMQEMAGKVWRALNSLATNSPNEYKTFVRQAMEEGKEVLNPPEPVFCFSVGVRGVRRGGEGRREGGRGREGGREGRREGGGRGRGGGGRKGEKEEEEEEEEVKRREEEEEEEEERGRGREK